MAADDSASVAVIVLVPIAAGSGLRVAASVAASSVAIVVGCRVGVFVAVGVWVAVRVWVGAAIGVAV